MVVFLWHILKQQKKTAWKQRKHLKHRDKEYHRHIMYTADKHNRARGNHTTGKKTHNHFPRSRLCHISWNMWMKWPPAPKHVQLSLNSPYMQSRAKAVFWQITLKVMNTFFSDGFFSSFASSGLLYVQWAGEVIRYVLCWSTEMMILFCASNFLDNKKNVNRFWFPVVVLYFAVTVKWGN